MKKISGCEKAGAQLAKIFKEPDLFLTFCDG